MIIRATYLKVGYLGIIDGLDRILVPKAGLIPSRFGQQGADKDLKPGNLLANS